MKKYNFGRGRRGGVTRSLLIEVKLVEMFKIVSIEFVVSLCSDAQAAAA